MEARAAARWKVLAAAALFSTGGAVVKACDLGGWQVACFRSGVGALALLAMVPAARRRWKPSQALVGCAYAATLILYVLANKRTTASNAIFLQSTAPLYMLLLAPLWLGEGIRRRDVLFMLALAGGMLLFFAGAQAPQRTAPDPWIGNLLGAASAVSWALTVAGLRWIARSEGRPQGSPAGAAAGASVLGNLIVFLVCLPLALPLGPSGALDWVWIGWLGVFQIGLAYVCLTAGVRRVPAFEGTLLLLVEPVLNTLWAWLFHGEQPGAWSLVGGGVILGATAWHALAGARRPRAGEQTDPSARAHDAVDPPASEGR